MTSEPLVPQQAQTVEEAVEQSHAYIRSGRFTADPGISTIEDAEGVWHRWRGRGFRRGKPARIETRCRRLIPYIDARTSTSRAVTCKACGR